MNQKYFLFSILICVLTLKNIYPKPSHARLIAEKTYLQSLLLNYQKERNISSETPLPSLLCGTKPPKSYSSSDFKGSSRKRQSLAALYNLRIKIKTIRKNSDQ